MRTKALIVSLTMTIAAAAFMAAAQDVQSTPKPGVKYSPYPEETFPNQVFFGDTHLHTGYSTDAGMVGCTLGPEDAYRFARGETVTSSQGCRRSCSGLMIFSYWKELSVGHPMDTLLRIIGNCL